MPSTAPDTRSVPRQQSPVKLVPITVSKQRCDYRRDVVFDVRLSPGARLLYVALDDYARLSAEAWPHQETLAERLGVSRAQLQRWLYELIESQYVERIRGQTGNTYRLMWGVSLGNFPCITSDASDASPMMRPLYETGPETGQQQQRVVDAEFLGILGEMGALINGVAGT